jgi:hypothetical protein
LGQEAKPLTCLSGAYHNLENFFENLLTTYLVCDGFGINPMREEKTILWKVSWDGRNLLGKNESFTLTPLNTTFPQSSFHTRDFAIAAMSENATEFKKVAEEIGLDEFLSDFDQRACTINGKDHHMKVIISADWMGLITELRVPRPNTQVVTDSVCWCCGATKEYLRIG